MGDLRYLNLKAELLVEGIRATPVALKEVGKKYISYLKADCTCGHNSIHNLLTWCTILIEG